ncbi:oligosaccharide flippase family protein [Coleofasciculus sp. FACHB-SPT9]|uniref:oligosaccharide flippase family protein n=1 Tax=Cyanophyceae TaxID=3028117 RepID=UPI00168A05B1|nr:oligosaccharide flippase family protein [Coleofasciculus sp. FACHB-SPT9]MBD1889373.1 oligosaccharide flippase family protein [Coleofasciculus sp. FACHB-SPT9]
MFFVKYISRTVRFLKLPDGDKNLSKRVLHGISWAVVSTVISRSLTFGIALIQSNLLGKQGYGELGMVLSTLLLFGVLSSGYGATCSKFISELRLTYPVRAARIFALSTTWVVILTIITSSALIIFSDFIANNILNEPRLAPLLKLAAIALGIQSLIGVCNGVLYGLQAFKILNLATLSQVIVWFPATAMLTYQWGLLGAMFAYVISYILSFLIYILAVVKECKRHNFLPVFDNMWLESSVLVNYTLPIVINNFLVIPTNWIGNAILSQQRNGYSSLGGYNAASQWRILVLQGPFLLQSTLSPVLSEMLGKGDISGFSKLFYIAYRTVFGIVILTGVSAILFSKSLLTIFGKDFTSEYLLMGLIMLTATIISLSGIVGMALQLINRNWIALLVNIVMGVVSIGLIVVLVPQYSSVGLAFAFTMAYLLQSFLSIYLLNKFIPEINLFFMSNLLLKAVLICVIAVLVTQLSGWIGAACQGITIILAIMFSQQIFHESVSKMKKYNNKINNSG